MVHRVWALRLPMGIGLIVWLVGVLSIGPRESAADTLTFLPCDAAAAEARIDAVLCAEHRIDLAYFIISDDGISQCLLDSLLAAARRSVQVRIIVDGLNNDIPDDVQMALLCSGAKIKQYHPLEPTELASLTSRLHDKLLIADGTEMIVGSRNIEDTHFGLRCSEEENYRDLDVRVKGRTVTQASCYFEGLWNSNELQAVSTEVLCARMRRQQRKTQWLTLLGLTEVGCESESPVACGHTAATRNYCGCCENVAFEVNADAMCFLCDPSGRKWCCGDTRDGLYRILESAQCSIVLESPYFVPSDELGQIFQTALARGVRVIILTNSWQTNDYPVIYADYRNAIGRLERLGAEVWEYAGPRMLHAKSLVVDGQIACVTSFNFDSRSAWLDTQVGLLVCDIQVAHCLLAILQSHFAEARPITGSGCQASCRQPALLIDIVGTNGYRTLEAARRRAILDECGIGDAARLSLLRVAAPIVHGQL